jgi:hypothetical protein
MNMNKKIRMPLLQVKHLLYNSRKRVRTFGGTVCGTIVVASRKI